MFHVKHFNNKQQINKSMSTQSLKDAVRNISNFPVDGIEFKDITTLFQSAERLQELSDVL